MRSRLRRFARPSLIVIALLVSAGIAGAQAPSLVPFQGLLLDSGGSPVTGVVDLDFALHDALVGGTQLFSESHSGVSVVDGIYSVELGTTTALTPGVLAGGTAFLEIVVDGETMTPRQQFLSVPYALVAEQSTQLGGLPAIYYEQLLEHVSFDAGDPPNLDPSEGFGDTDGDGLPNFVDSDNDDDGVGDVTELGQGDDINLFTPRISFVTPPGARATYTPTSYRVSGTGLQHTQSVQVGADTISPYSLSASQLFFDYETPNEGVQSVTVVAANGESATEVDVLTFNHVLPTITSLAPELIPDGVPFTMTIQGTNFVSQTTVVVEGVPLVPTVVSDTELTVDVPPQTANTVEFMVTHPTGQSVPEATAVALLSTFTRTIFSTESTHPGDFGGALAADTICQNEASTYGIPGTFMAWVSDSTTNPSARFLTTGAPYYNLQGARVATNFAALASTLEAPIAETPTGATANLVWTGSFGNGTVAGGSAQTCNDWTSVALGSTGRHGNPSWLTGWSWSTLQDIPCAGAYHLICVEQ